MSRSRKRAASPFRASDAVSSVGEADQVEKSRSLYNRRGNKDSQLK